MVNSQLKSVTRHESIPAPQRVESQCAVAVRQTQVSEQMERVYAAIDRVQNSAGKIVDRIASVTREQDNKGCEACPRPTLVSMADALCTYADRLNATADLLEDATNRVEL